MVVVMKEDSVVVIKEVKKNHIRISKVQEIKRIITKKVFHVVYTGLLTQNQDYESVLRILSNLKAPVRLSLAGNINQEIVEASPISGCTPRQLLFKVRLPLALPEILLGINQTIMLALSMLVITALVGTRDLGQEVYIALAKADIGRGLVAGLGVAFIAIIADKIIVASSNRLKIKYGIM